MWLCQSSLSSIITPSDFVEVTWLTWVLFILIVGEAVRVPSLCLDPISMNSVFVIFSVSLFACSQLKTFVKSSFRQSCILSRSPPAYVRCVSSAYVQVSRFLSSQTGHLTIQSQYNFWKPPHPFDWSLSLFVVNLLTVLESEEAFTQSLVESLNDSLISMNVHISSSYPNIMLCHLSCDFTHEFTRRINLKNLWPSQWFMLINCLKSSTDLKRNIWGERFDSLESACNINNFQCIFIYRISFLSDVCHEEGKEDQLDLLDLWIAHQKFVLVYV